MNKYYELRRRINKHCPHLMELGFGCEFWATVYADDDEEKRRILFVNVSERMYSDDLVLGRVQGNWETVHIPKSEIVQILGIPPTLQDVMRAVSSCENWIDLKNDSKDGKKERLYIRKVPGEWDIQVRYNLTKPLSEQSEETLDFLLSVIE